MAESKGARSYKGEVIGDSMAITINFKWLLQILVFTAMLVYAFWQYEARLQELERNMAIALTEVEVFEQQRADAEAKRVADLEAQMLWYESELNLNPFSWGKGKGKKK